MGVTGYNVYRDGTLLPPPTGTTFSEPAPAPGTSHTYAIVATDAANHTSESDINVTIPGGPNPAAPIDVASNQYIPQSWQDDFYNNLTLILRQRMAALLPGSLPPPAARFWYDPGDTIIVGTPPPYTDTMIHGTTGQYAYFDSNGSGQWNGNDPVWAVSGNTAVYTGQSFVYTPSTGNVSVPIGIMGKTNICFATVNSSLLIWADSTTSFGQDLVNFYGAVNTVLPYYDSGAGNTYNPAADRLSVGTVLADMPGGPPATTFQSDTVTISAPSTGTLSWTVSDSAGALSQELIPGDSILLSGVWYPIQSWTANQITLSQPYIGLAVSAPLTVRNWTLVPSLSDSGTGAKFSYERGNFTAGDLVFPQQFDELHFALSMMNNLAPFYGQTNYGARSSQFISVATDVLNAYESVFGTQAAADATLRNDILNGKYNSDATEDTTGSTALRGLVHAIEEAVYVRDGNGWVAPHGTPLTFAEDLPLLQALLPEIDNSLDKSIVIRQAGSWSGDPYGHSLWRRLINCR